MAELSIEEKAKAYDELLKKLQEAKEDNNVCDERYCCVIDDIVPELKQSEDDRIRQRIINALHGDVLEMSEIKEAIAWLEKQGEKKSADKVELDAHKTAAWIEEDEKILQWIITDIERLINDNKKADIIANQEIKWLKSLRPQNTWKPSDEQMIAIKQAVKDMKESPCYDSELVSLFNDLKKLREEQL